MENGPKLGVEREKGRSWRFNNEYPVFKAEENVPECTIVAGRGKAAGAFVSSRCSEIGTRGICDWQELKVKSERDTTSVRLSL